MLPYTEFLGKNGNLPKPMPYSGKDRRSTGLSARRFLGETRNLPLESLTAIKASIKIDSEMRQEGI